MIPEYGQYTGSQGFILGINQEFRLERIPEYSQDTGISSWA